MLNQIRLPLIFLSAALVGIGQSSAAEPASRAILETIKVGGPDGWDYTTFDPVTHTLYIAHGSGIASMNATNPCHASSRASARSAACNQRWSFSADTAWIRSRRVGKCR